MNDDIKPRATVELARQAGAYAGPADDVRIERGEWIFADDDLERFAALARAQAPIIGYSNGQGLMTPEVFEAWRAQRATPEQAAQWRPVAYVD